MIYYIIAIDPGPRESAYVILDISKGFPSIIVEYGKMSSELVQINIGTFMRSLPVGVEVIAGIEMPACYGMAIGADVFNTCAIVGHFESFFRQELRSISGVSVPTERVYRKRTSENNIDGVCISLCKNNRASDSNIRQALIDLYPPIGGGKIPQIGLKNSPGPLFGISKDVWAALAVGITLHTHLMKK